MLFRSAGGPKGNYTTSGSITDIFNTNVNIGGIKTEGVDVITDYKFPSTAIGDFKASLDATFVKQYVLTEPFNLGPLSSQEQSGTTTAGPGTTGTGGVIAGVPKQRATFGLNWNYGDWSAMWNMEYISSLIEDCGSTTVINPASRCPLTGSFPFETGTPPLNHIGATTYHDVFSDISPVSDEYRLHVRYPQ